MLLQSLIDTEPQAFINDYLYDPINNSQLKEKISFIVIVKPSSKTFSRRSKKSLTEESNEHLNFLENYFKNNSTDQKTEVAESVLRIAEFCLQPLRLKQVTQSSSNLSWTIPNIISERFQNTKSKLSKNKLSNMVTSWQVTVKLHQLKGFNYRQNKDLKSLSNNENIYCVIEIGDKKKTTSCKNIGTGLIYNEVID